MKYPRYSKKNDLRCKLTNKDIKEIRKMARKNIRMKEIAEKFNVSKSTIWFWIIDEEERQEVRERKRLISQKHRDKMDPILLRKLNCKALQKWVKRKRMIQKAFREYQRIKRKEFLIKNPHKRREY